MGTLAHFPLAAMARLHSIQHFVETGTAQGDGLAIAAQVKELKSLHSIEIIPELAASAKARFASDKRIKVWQGNSVDVMEKILNKLPADPCLFWLDAHFPGAHTGADYAAEEDAHKRLPLVDEVELIANVRVGIRDILLIDDARIYQPGPYGDGDLPADWPPLKGVDRSLDFVRQAFSATHGVVVDYADQGYVMVVPRPIMRKAA